MPDNSTKNVLITGANGYIGREMIAKICLDPAPFGNVIALDVKELPAEDQRTGIEYCIEDIRSPEIETLLRSREIDTVVHLAAIVSPQPHHTREFLHSVEVQGTENILKASIAAGVKKIIITSSGAAYGYHADNPEWLKESDQLRGNVEFPYSDHKRQVEEMLADYRQRNPELKQLIFRPGTVLGANVNNQITNLFDQKVVFGLSGASSPFVFIWDQDVVNCIWEGVLTDKAGIFNLAGDGTLGMKELAGMLKKPFLPIPVFLVTLGLTVLSKLGLTRYGPEQVNFLRYRPVLSNTNLKDVFGYTPQKSSQEVFEYYLANRNTGKSPLTEI